MGRPTPTHPTLFAKYDGSLIGAHDDIHMPPVSDDLDWEAELGIVIGRPGRHIPRHHALEHVAGYTVANDVTVRDWQHRTREFLSGKTFEATTPVGPTLVTPDELPPGASGLTISCSVDGHTMQKSNTADLLFDVADIIAYVSTIITRHQRQTVTGERHASRGAHTATRSTDERVFDDNVVRPSVGLVRNGPERRCGG